MFSVQPLIVAALLTQLGLVVGSCAKGELPETHLTEKDNPKLYSGKVIHAEVVKKPLWILPIFGWISHSGVVVTLDEPKGKKLLIHKIGCGAVLQDPAVMEGVDWEVTLKKDCSMGITVGVIMKAGGKGYNVAIDNCHEFRNWIWSNAKRTMEKK